MTKTVAPQEQRRTAMETDQLFAGSGDMRALCRLHRWENGPLGAVEAWPASLRSSAQMVLSAPLPMLVFWGPELVQIFNDAFRPSLGDTADITRALGAPAAEYWAEVWETRGPEIEHVLHGGAAVQHADVCLRMTRDGQCQDVWWTYCDMPLFGDDASIAGVLVVCQETTARVHAEREQARLVAEGARADKRAARILDQISDEHLMMDKDFSILSMNAAAERNLGVPRETCIGKTHWEAFPSSVGTVVERNYRRAMTDRVDIHFAHRYTGEGHDRHLEIDAYPTDEGGLALFWREVTARKEAEAERERLLAEAEAARADAVAANRAKGEFLAVMSHELRTPLQAIDGYAELIELGVRGPITDEQRHDLSRIRKSEKHLLGLINGVLSYAQVEAGVVHYEIDDVVVDDVLVNCEALTAPQIRAHSLVMGRHPCDRELRVHADREKLQQIILNLLSNAIKCTESGGRIDLRCRQGTSTEGNVIHIDVADTGVGIADSQLERIFEPFVQIDSNLTRTGEGTGLGLAICRDLARGMGGNVTAQSTVGLGSTFTVTLRAAD